MLETTHLYIRKKRAIFRATHRGFREMDILLGQFVTEEINNFSQADIAVLEELLDIPDWDIYEWITGTRAIPVMYNTIILKRLKTFYQEHIRS